MRTGSLLTVIVFSPFRYVSSIIFFYLWRPALELNGLPYVNKVLLYFTLLYFLEESQELTKRITTPYMTKYERARVLGTRALQIR